jgi:hypothetical protein
VNLPNLCIRRYIRKDDLQFIKDVKKRKAKENGKSKEFEQEEIMTLK